jgi:alpha-L-rhamnosidase
MKPILRSNLLIMKKNLLLVAAFVLITTCHPVSRKAIQPVELKCEYLEEPMGMDREHPRFAWIIRSEKHDILQSAYEIMVSKADAGFADPSIVWHTGKVPSALSVNVRYEGGTLESQKDYYWRVRIWDDKGRESSWSEPARFHTGFLGRDGFSSGWIKAPDPALRSPLMRKEFSIEKEVGSAFVYATSIGLYELYLNGSKVDDRIFEPATSQFSERVLYSVYDVTEHLIRGKNAVGVWMGEGQSAYSIPPEGRFHNVNMRVPSFDRPMMLLELRINYRDGSHELIGTDSDWKCAPGPLTFNNYFGGEDYDARLEVPGWSAAGFDETGWQQVIPGHYEGKVSAQLLQPVREGRRYEPVAVVRRDELTTDYDFGTTIGGYWEIEVEGEAGVRVMIRGTEKCGSPAHQKPLTEEHELYWESNHTGQYFYRDCWSVYTLKGGGREVYKPRFFYQGYRYVQVRVSDPRKVRVIRLNNIEVENAVAMAGVFECSDEYLNRLHGNIVQTFRNNLIQGVPLSNPNSEKYGWTGDVHLFSETADYTYDLAAFWTQWLQDFPDAQQWVQAGGLIPVTVPELRVKRHIVSDVSWLAVYPFLLRQMYRHCQDTSIVRVHYGPLKKWVNYILSISDGDIADGVWGDHQIPGDGQRSLGASRGMTRLLNTAYLYRISEIMSEFAGLMGSSGDESHYKNLATRVCPAFNKEFFKASQGHYMESPSPEGFYYGLTANLVPLQMGLVPDTGRKEILGYVLDQLRSKDYSSYTGILGTKALVDVLQEAGEQAFLYRIVRNTGFPGWGYTMDTLGGSTLNQNWNGRGDFNHCMFGSIDEFFYNDLLGIRFDFSGTKKMVKIAPFVPDELTFARGKAHTIFGTVASGWERKAGFIQYTISIPHNTNGLFTCAVSSEDYDVEINGQPVVRNGLIVHEAEWIKQIQFNGREVSINLGSGNYELMIKNK